MIRARVAVETQSLIATGRDLALIKQRTEHGMFANWVELECGISPRKAQLYMRAAEWAETNAKLISHLQPTAVLKLAAPSTSASVILTVVDHVEKGEPVSLKVVDRLLREARDAKREEEKRAKEEGASKRTKEARKARKEKEEREAKKRRENQRLLDDRAAATRGMLSAFLVRYLPDDALDAVLRSVSVQSNESDLRIWDKSFRGGVLTSPMADAIHAARAVKNSSA